MNPTFIMISLLVKSNLGERCLINALMNVLSEALENYLDMANIYNGKSTKKKTHLLEVVIYGCITNTTIKANIKDIRTKELNRLLKEHKILVKSLPGHGNKGLKKKEVKPVSSEPSIKVEADK